MASIQHRWKFHRVGGLDQASLATAQDLAHLAQLDQKLWTALSCPTRGLELDPKTLDLLDADGDGRVRAPDVVGAVAWCGPRLADLVSLIPGHAELPLAAISTATPEGQTVLAAAKLLLSVKGKPGATAIGPTDVADLSNVFVGTPYDGTGVALLRAADGDEQAKEVIAAAAECVGISPNRPQGIGIDREKLKAFYEQLQTFARWWGDGKEGGVWTLGPATHAAWTAVSAVRAKVDDYFIRCRLATVDPRAAAVWGRSEPELAAVAAKDLSATPPELAALPLARVEPGRALPLAEGVNPAWAGALQRLAADAITPVFGAGRTSLSADDWAALLEKLTPYDEWQARKEGASVERLGIERVMTLLGEGVRARVEALIDKDLEFAPTANAISDVVRLVHYHRDLHTLLRNFVSFGDFYDPTRSAIFQAGTLYLDSRSCELCVRVEDIGAHAALAQLSRMCIAYCECKRVGSPAVVVAACFTQGDSDFLIPGRNGVFYDRQGRDWDAHIVKIIENPISIRQAFFAPYKKFVRMVEEQAAKFAAAKEQESHARLSDAAAGTVGHATGTAKPPSPVDVGRMVGIIAAIGVGAGALGTLLGGLVSGFMGLHPWWAKLVAVAGVLAVISGPSVFIAWLKLRQRTLGPVLDANGWAINGRVAVNLPLGVALTARAALPPGAVRSLRDPYADRAATRRKVLFWLAALAVAGALVAARIYRVWPFGPLPLP
jgi:hypothetical protein